LSPEPRRAVSDTASTLRDLSGGAHGAAEGAFVSRSDSDYALSVFAGE
jgi:hypothetical protein